MLFHDFSMSKPISPAFAELMASIKNMTGSGLLQLLNHAVSCLEEDEIHLEIGSYQGCTIVGAILGNRASAVAIDNFSQFDDDGDNEKIILNHLKTYDLDQQVRLVRQNYIKPWPLEGKKVGSYFYDGPHTYDEELYGLKSVEKHLADRAIIVVDDTNWPQVRRSVEDYLVNQPKARLLMDIRTTYGEHPIWHNGIMVYSWENE